ncbi:uncharacterized protein (TIGR02001 family) [Altererythrobacter atlanticus]|uniref:Uncharacterized protein n=1 Tax=Croceibacterium atlanticum TaxID=1267766 RepID=A0A0F7KVC5_9SPHN|nr:TorF family putative porin [Croceibacterium atlanticum]AKH43187.1 Bacterial protein of unknown function [Croceibacterium atlanticum]MBB5732108.1 uncharacterized protein (TIGR02001 family) [Croceibacterium atlanticum]
MKIRLLAGLACLTVSTPAMAQELGDSLTVAGEVSIVSDYRFRGVSQTDKEAAIQGGISVSHDSGFYVGTWASNLAGWGTFSGSNMELDIYGGYATEISDGLTMDVGVTWFMYPGGSDTTDFAEAFASLSGQLGPANLAVGVNYAPKQEALANVSNTPQSNGQKQDNLYLWTDAETGLPGTPVTLRAHLGYSDGNPGLGPNGTSIAPTGDYFDWSLGADVAAGPLTLGISYVDTSISAADAAYLQPGFSSTKDGSSIAGSTVVFSVSAGF